LEWIGDWAAKRALLTPKWEAIVDNIEMKRYTYADMNIRANQLARILLDLGIGKGDRVGMLSANQVGCIDIFFATGKIGAIFVPFNIRLALPETIELIKKIQPKCMFYSTQFVAAVQEIKKTKIINHFFKMESTGADEDPSIRTLMEKKSGHTIDRPKIDFEDPHLILFTGGTTGLPKGAVLSHRLIFWNVINTISSWHLSSKHIQPLLYPMFHTGGWNVLLLPFYYLGAKSIIMGAFKPDDILRVIEREKCTHVIGVPTMFLEMSKSPIFKSINMDSVEIFISGGAPCPVVIMEKYWALNKQFKMGYGLTEVGPNNFYLPEEFIKQKPTSVGLPVFHCDMKIVNLENQKQVKPGETGELMLRGPHIFSGYWLEPEETCKTIDVDGWVHTGDLARTDAEGFYYIVGRKKEMYISGGENVFPVEIEEILYKHEAVDLTAVIGVPDEKWGEVGKAIVTLKPNKQVTPDELRDYLIPRLAKYKIPKYFEIRKEIPLSASGKILKKDLK
jgi:fatty-acyl-CoA synthase